jgi:hypothetical protein
MCAQNSEGAGPAHRDKIDEQIKTAVRRSIGAQADPAARSTPEIALYEPTARTMAVRKQILQMETRRWLAGAFQSACAKQPVAMLCSRRTGEKQQCADNKATYDNASC